MTFGAREREPAASLCFQPPRGTGDDDGPRGDRPRLFRCNRREPTTVEPEPPPAARSTSSWSRSTTTCSRPSRRTGTGWSATRAAARSRGTTTTRASPRGATAARASPSSTRSRRSCATRGGSTISRATRPRASSRAATSGSRGSAASATSRWVGVVPSRGVGVAHRKELVRGGRTLAERRARTASATPRCRAPRKRALFVRMR